MFDSFSDKILVCRVSHTYPHSGDTPSIVYAVVALDDIGYVQQDREETEVLFTFLAERYERRSVMITSNLVFSRWDQIFKGPDDDDGGGGPVSASRHHSGV
jgi:DNA replication protein DnaC